MSAEEDRPSFFFCIPLQPKANANNWERVCTVLNQTLRSIQNQINQEFTVFIAGQDRPNIDDDISININWIAADWSVQNANNEKLRDKRRKRILLLRAVRGAGGGYVMMLDADDLVSNQLVDYVLKDRNPNGYIIEKGYAYDWGNGFMAPIPGAWSKTFDSVCGSCSVINFGVEDLPRPRSAETDEGPPYLAAHLKQHSQWKHVMSDLGRPLAVIPFPAAVYVLNHSNNLHYSIKAMRQEEVPLRIAKRKLAITPELSKEFSLPITPAATP
jgi:hypothetical protein